MKTNTMKLNFLMMAAMSLALCNCRGGVEPEFDTNVKVTISDEDGAPIEGAEVKLLFSHFDPKKNVTHVINTDAKGMVQASEKVVSSLLLNAGKPGFYPLRFERVLIRMDVDWQKIKQRDLALIMRRIKQPAPLYAKKVSAIIPDYDKPIGFDFMVGDWVVPHGKGKSPDMLLNFSRKLVGYRGNIEYEDMVKDLESIYRDNPRKKETYFKSFEERYGKFDKSDYREVIDTVSGKWDGKLSVAFPNPQEGIADAKNDYCHYSELTLPHEAYPEGYSKDLHIKTDNHTPKNTPPDPAYFVRTRVTLDEKGEIASANYAKITSPIHFDPRGRIEFTYVFNPTPNDRNLEFDTSKNKFADLKFEERVVNP
jgi:hypothetical protein